jgi:hypothetical protein
MRDRQSDVYSTQSHPLLLKPGDEVYRVYITANRKTIRSGPHQVLNQVGTNTYAIDGYAYPIPAYQLHLSEPRPSHLTLTETSPAVISSTTSPIQGEPGDLVLFETFDILDEHISVDVGEWKEQHGNEVTLVRYWYNTNGEWLRWDDELVNVNIHDIKVVGFKLTKNNRIPQKILRTFMH